MTAFYDRIWNQGDLDAIREIALTDFTFRGSLGTQTKGYDGFIEYGRGVRAALADYRCDIVTSVCEGEQAFARMSYGGRHVQRFMGFEPTGLPVQWQGAALFRFERDKIANLWVLGDLPMLQSQLTRNEREMQRQHESG